MKQTVFNALTKVESVSAALNLGNGTNFLFNETQVRTGKQGGGYKNQRNSQSLAALRHKIHFYTRDTSSTIGYHQKFDILESDDATKQSKTSTRPGLSRNPARDDDDRLRYNEPDDWS
jgi:hypothetical protein